MGEGGFDADGGRWDAKVEAHSGLQLVFDGAANGYWGGNHLVAELKTVSRVVYAEDVDWGMAQKGDRSGFGGHEFGGIWVNTPYRIFDIAAVP